jgi:predicted nucleic acid-binding protein
VIYLDTSVALAQLLAEDRQPPAALWARPLVASRLLDFELWTRLHARGLGATHAAAARQLLGRVSYLELVSEVLGRAREPWPTPVRTLDALHLASALFLRDQGVRLEVATYDGRLAAAARAVGLPLHPLE